MERNGERVREHYRQRQKEYTEWLHALNDSWSCVLCDGPAEHWHHVDPFSKRREISAMETASLDTIESELGKCVPMCAPCHAHYHNPGGVPKRP